MDEVAQAVATGAAGNVVAYMLSGQVDALQAKITRIFRHQSTEAQAETVHSLEVHAAALSNETESSEHVIEHWARLLRSELSAHPDVREDVEGLAKDSTTGSISIGSQHNHGSGAFIGGNNYGGITFNTGNERQ